ncbi:NAD(P)H-dependent oxidoreductase subunit E [Euzebya sp.]|uniref:NADH-quinone oxidoreductase subunit NuoE family protein n=1 Tax=Euzebya sp. TaxID=1971409 RepID=UPI003512E0AA
MFSPENREKAEGLVARYPVKRSALLPLLHLVQHQDGYVSDDGIAECAELLDLTKAEVAAVSTFYTMYKREPMGRHLVSICTNFACAVRGGKAVYDRVSEHLGVGHDQTTEDGTITLEHAECLGNCEGAPLISVDYINYEMVDVDEAVELVDRIRAGDVPEPTRGMIPPGVREASHRLAGIGPIDPEGPGQRLGLATAEHGAVPQPDVGPGIAPTIVAFTPPGRNGQQPDEVPAQDAGGVDDLGTQESVEEAAAAEGVDAERVAEEAAPSGSDPAVEGTEAEGADDADTTTDEEGR